MDKSFGHIPECRREATLEFVASDYKNRNRRSSKIVGDLERESVVIDEYRIEILVEKLFGNSPFELVETEIQEPETRKPEDHLWKFTYKPVVAEIELVQKLHPLERVWHRPAEPIGVDMEESEIFK